MMAAAAEPEPAALLRWWTFVIDEIDEIEKMAAAQILVSAKLPLH